MDSSLLIRLLSLIFNYQGELVTDLIEPGTISCLVDNHCIFEYMPHFRFYVMINKMQNADLNQPSYHTGNLLPPTPLDQIDILSKAQT